MFKAADVDVSQREFSVRQARAIVRDLFESLLVDHVHRRHSILMRPTRAPIPLSDSMFEYVTFFIIDDLILTIILIHNCFQNKYVCKNRI